MSALLGQVRRFAAVGAAGTVAYLLLFVVLRPTGAQAASLLARLLVAVPTTWLAARHVFRRRLDWAPAAAVAVGGLVLGAAASCAALALVAGAGRPTELVALGVTQAVVAGLRFLVLRRIVLTADPQPSSTDLRASAPTVVVPEGDTSRSLASSGASR